MSEKRKSKESDERVFGVSIGIGIIIVSEEKVEEEVVVVRNEG